MSKTTLSPVFILGMHRSGTSCLAGTLQSAGLFLGDVNTSAGFNKKGNRENDRVMSLHDSLLKNTGGSWYRPPSTTPVWSAEDLREGRCIVEGFPENRVWGIKDPRSLLVLDGWGRLVTPRFVGTFRHPNEVIASLLYRADALNQRMTEEEAGELWLTYNRRLLNVYQEKPFDLVRYDIPTDIYNAKVAKVAEKLGLDAEDVMPFREKYLRNQVSSSSEVPQSLKQVWEALMDAAV